MFRLYIAYLVVGLLFFRLVSIYWELGSPVGIPWKFISTPAAIVLFAITSVIALRKPKLGAQVGLVCMLGIWPFVWRMFRIGIAFINIPDAFALVCYIIALVLSAIVVLKTEPVVARKINGTLLKVLSIIPPVLLIIWVGLILVLFG